MFKTPVDDYRELCDLIYWGRASVILEILLTKQYNGMIDGFEHCSIVDHVSEEVRYAFFPSGHLSEGIVDGILMWCRCKVMNKVGMKSISRYFWNSGRMPNG